MSRPAAHRPARERTAAAMTTQRRPLPIMSIEHACAALGLPAAERAVLGQSATKPRPADVARWVAVLAAPEPRYGSSDWKYWRRDCDKARSSLRTWGLGDDGQSRGEAPLAEDEFAYLGVQPAAVST